MESAISFLRVLHISAGVLALCSGLLAMGLFKSSGLHMRAGKLFFYCMLLVFTTAVILSVNARTPFLFAIGVFSFYFTLHGVRSMRFFKGAQTNALDAIAASVLALTGIFLFGRGLYHSFSGFGVSIILHLVFGAAIMFLAFMSASALIQLKPGDMKWFRSHQASMGGALIATITAFCTTALDFLPALVAWIGPSLLLSPLLSIIIRRTSPNQSHSS